MVKKEQYHFMQLLGQTHKRYYTHQSQKYLLCFAQSMFLVHKNALFCMTLSYRTLYDIMVCKIAQTMTRVTMSYIIIKTMLGSCMTMFYFE